MKEKIVRARFYLIAVFVIFLVSLIPNGVYIDYKSSGLKEYEVINGVFIADRKDRVWGYAYVPRRNATINPVGRWIAAWTRNENPEAFAWADKVFRPEDEGYVNFVKCYPSLMDLDFPTDEAKYSEVFIGLMSFQDDPDLNTWKTFRTGDGKIHYYMTCFMSYEINNRGFER